MRKPYFSLKKTGMMFLCLMLLPLLVHAQDAWDRSLSIPDGDPLWGEVRNLWENRWQGGKVIDDLILTLRKLESKDDSQIAVHLWLGKAYYLKGTDSPSTRKENFKAAEGCAVKAHALDPGDLNALYILLSALSNREEREYVHSHYGEWIRSQAPLPTGELLPEMPPSPEWDEAIALWRKRNDAENLVNASRMFETMAMGTPEDYLAQMWACYAVYCLGEYYTLNGDHDKKGLPLYKEAIAYAEKALELNPHSDRARYWRQLANARKIQEASIFTKAAYLKPIMEDLLFCVRENPTYDGFGPIYILAAMVLEGGWVCRKGMEMAGYTVEMLWVLLEIAEILYPDQTFIPYVHALLLKHHKKHEAALTVFDRLIKTGPPAPDDPRRLEKTTYYQEALQLHRELSQNR